MYISQLLTYIPHNLSTCMWANCKQHCLRHLCGIVCQGQGGRASPLPLRALDFESDSPPACARRLRQPAGQPDFPGPSDCILPRDTSPHQDSTGTAPSTAHPAGTTAPTTAGTRGEHSPTARQPATASHRPSTNPTPRAPTPHHTPDTEM